MDNRGHIIQSDLIRSIHHSTLGSIYQSLCAISEIMFTGVKSVNMTLLER
ncbi:unnamed protein product [Absidia cylindrospora]